MHLAVLGLSRKFPTMARKFDSENLYFKHTEAQRHGDYFEHGKLGKNGNFRLLLPCGQWVFDKSL